MENLTHIGRKFALDGAIKKIYPFGSGHINDTYKIETNQKHYLLQRINHVVFKNVEGLTSNLIAVTAHLQNKIKGQPQPMQVLNSIPTQAGDYFVRELDGNYWRVFDFVHGSHSYDLVPGPGIAREGGRAWGWFVRMLSDFRVDGLEETIPDFHNAEFRITNFKNAVHGNVAGRLSGIRGLVDALLDRSERMKKIHSLGREGRIPLRVTHNDTKINNVLFNQDDQGMCVIDLDTVMPGYVHFDFGDAIRTFTNMGDEDEKDLDKIAFNLSYFKAFAEGFLSETRGILEREELRSLAFSPLYIVYEQTIRFLTDYLEGDRYYKTSYPEHNLVRSKAQFRLLEHMESSFKDMEDVIAKG